MVKKDTKKDVEKTAKPAPEKEVVEVQEEPKAVEGEVVQAKAPQPQASQGNGKKWCCCCGIIFAIFILVWILLQFLSFFMPIFPPLMPGF